MKRKINHNRLVLLSLVIFGLVATYLIIKAFTMSSQIALVINPGSCVTGVSYFAITGNCTNGSTQKIEYTCYDGRSVTLDQQKEDRCLDQQEIYANAQSYCGKQCLSMSPTPTPLASLFPKPTMSPKPIESADPTPTPTPKPSCFPTRMFGVQFCNGRFVRTSIQSR